MSDVVGQHVERMSSTMTDNVTTKTMLDVESKVGKSSKHANYDFVFLTFKKIYWLNMTSS